MKDSFASILAIAETVIRGQIRRKDVYVVFILLGAILLLIASLDILGISSVVTYVLEIGLLSAWIFGWILSVYSAARELPQEETRGTIFSLLAKPVTRCEVIIGKWLGCWVSVTTAVLLFYVLVVVLVIARHGYVHPIVLAQGFALHAGALAVMSSVAIAFSTRMNQDAAATLSYLLTAVSFLVVPKIPEFVFRESGSRAVSLLLLYHILPHFEVMDMRTRLIFGFGPAPWKAVIAAAAYATAVTIFFLAVANMAYRNKRFSRSKLAVL